MKKSLCLVCAVVLPLGYRALAIPYGGVEFPQGGSSFADEVIAYSIVGGGVLAPHADATKALGIPDYANDDGYVSLGASAGGYLILKFSDNSLTTSGNSDNDLWVFEIGGAVEPTQVFISQNGVSWIDLGLIQGSTRGIDIDNFTAAGVQIGAQYSYVKLVEVDPSGAPDSGSPFSGADIDAVGAISSAPPVATPEVASTFGLLALGLASLRMLARRWK